MRLRVQYKLVPAARLDLPLRLLGERQVRVFHHLRKQEALLVVVPIATIFRVDVRQARKPRARAAIVVDCAERAPDPIAVLYSSDASC